MEEDNAAHRRREALRRVMAERRLTQTGWARDAGVPESTLRQFLTGDSKSLNIDTYEKLAKAAKTTVSVLVGEASQQAQNMLDVYERLSLEDREHFLRTMTVMAQQHSQETTSNPANTDSKPDKAAS